MKTDFDEFDQAPEDISATVSKPDVSKEDEQEEIFLRGINGGGEWKTPEGKRLKLSPLSYNRRRAAFAMGCRFGSLSQDEVEALQADGYYKGLDTDAVIVTWLCLQDPSVVLKALRLPETALERALKWGEANDVEPGTAAFTAAAEFMMEEFMSLMKAKGKFQPAESGKKTPKGKSPGKR